jgi:hypothetical protein
LSPEVGAREREAAERAVGLGGGGSSRSAIDEWFGKGVTFAGGGYWRVEGGVVTSPELVDGASVGFRSTREHRGDVRIRIESQASALPSKTAIVFGFNASKNGNHGYILELRHTREFTQLRLLHQRIDGHLDELVTRYVALSRAERASFLDLAVELRGDRIAMSAAGGLVRAETRAVGETVSGNLGCFVSGDSPHTGPVRFRNLRVEPL